MFVGRESELKQLNKLYKDNEFQFVVMYGRRRVGKTFLLTEFIRNKEAVCFAAEQRTPMLLLQSLSDAILSRYPSPMFTSFEDFGQAVLYMGQKAEQKPIGNGNRHIGD